MTVINEHRLLPIWDRVCRLCHVEFIGTASKLYCSENCTKRSRLIKKRNSGKLWHQRNKDKENAKKRTEEYRAKRREKRNKKKANKQTMKCYHKKKILKNKTPKTKEERSERHKKTEMYNSMFLSDTYLKKIISKRRHFNIDDVPEELIKAQRENIRLKRKIQEVENGND